MANLRKESVEPGDNPEDDAGSVPEDAFLVIDGVKVIPLTRTLVSIGRRVENTVVLDDPRVSRNHAHLRAIKGRYVLYDLDSTGGSFVNGVRVTQKSPLSGRCDLTGRRDGCLRPKESPAPAGSEGYCAPVIRFDSRWGAEDTKNRRPIWSAVLIQ